MNKKETLKIIVISAIVSMIVSLMGCMLLIRWANGLNLSIEDFTVTDFTYNRDKDTYYTSYSGEAKIYCKDTTQPYLLVVSTKLISGGDTEEIGKTSTGIVIINDGVGTISTYDYGETGEITQPTYEIKVIGFRTLSK